MFLYIILGFILLMSILIIVLHQCLEKKTVFKDLKNKHVVVTGGSSGIGKAVAAEAAKLGAHVTIIGRDIQKLILAVSDVSAHCKPYSGQKIQYASLDVTSDYGSIEKCLSKLETDVGPIFMLVNCAGMCICGQFDKMKVDDIKLMIDLNYFGTAYPTRYVLPKMKERDEGLIVFVSTEAALLGEIFLCIIKGLKDTSYQSRKKFIGFQPCFFPLFKSVSRQSVVVADLQKRRQLSYHYHLILL